jgi:succinate dehydrogenase / fumarate reductase iron-sulfur subunit
MTTTPTEVVFKIRRFDPAVDQEPHWEEHRIPYTHGLTVLDGLRKIKEVASPSLAWRSSCRMFINGRPRLACNTQITELGTNVVLVAPLPNFKIVRDLVPDLMPMFDAHVAMHPYLVRDDVKEQYEPTGEFFQSSHEVEQYLQFSYCIKCGCCMAACPTYATDPAYSGPMPLTSAHRYNVDTRDAGFKTRKPPLAGERGPWRCHYAGECSRVCPKGVDPGKAIQLMKRELVLDYLHLLKHGCPAKLVGVPAGTKRRENIPDAPVPTMPNAPKIEPRRP